MLNEHRRRPELLLWLSKWYITGNHQIGAVVRDDARRRRRSAAVPLSGAVYECLPSASTTPAREGVLTDRRLGEPDDHWTTLSRARIGRSAGLLAASSRRDVRIVSAMVQ